MSADQLAAQIDAAAPRPTIFLRHIAEIVAERRAAMESWRSWRASREEYAEWLAAERVRVLGEERSKEKEFEIATVEVEEAVDSREEVVPPGEL